MQITENVYLIPLGFVNAYLISSEDELTLIDTGIPGSEKKIITGIRDIGKSTHDLKSIFITHADADHAGSIAALKAVSGARVYASRPEADAIEKGESSRKKSNKGLFGVASRLLARFFRIVPVKVDEILKDGDEFSILGGLKVLDTSGHTPGHLSFYSVSSGILFSGDSAISAKDGLHSSRSSFTWDQGKAMAAYEKQAALKPGIVCSGHGPILRSPNVIFNN